jgi:hypothetical protein
MKIVIKTILHALRGLAVLVIVLFALATLIPKQQSILAGSMKRNSCPFMMTGWMPGLQIPKASI